MGYDLVSLMAPMSYMQDFVENFIESLPDVKCPYVAPQQCPTAAGAAALIGNVVTTVGLIILAVLLL